MAAAVPASNVAERQVPPAKGGPHGDTIAPDRGELGGDPDGARSGDQEGGP